MTGLENTGSGFEFHTKEKVNKNNGFYMCFKCSPFEENTELPVRWKKYSFPNP